MKSFGDEGRSSHALQAFMLSDPDLVATDAFGLSNMVFTLRRPGDDTDALPVPTSLLIDRQGKVLWMDKSKNYQRRSGPEVVRAALLEHLD